MYGKLFSSMYEGTLYGQWQAIVTLQQLVILADADGVVDMTPPAIAARTSIPLDIIEAGLSQLSEVDRYSRTPTEDGRRIVLVDQERPWGWRIVNYRYYRDLASREDKKAKDRERIAEKRKQNSDVAECREVSQNVADVAHTNTNTDTGSSSTKKKARTRAAFVKPTVDQVAEYCRERKNGIDADQFVDHYTSNGWKVGGKAPMKDWKAAIRYWEKNGYAANKPGMARAGRGETIDDKLRRLRGDGKPSVGEPDGGVRGQVLEGIWGRA